MSHPAGGGCRDLGGAPGTGVVPKPEMKTQRPIARSPAHAPLQPIPECWVGMRKQAWPRSSALRVCLHPWSSAPAGRRPRPLAETSSEEEGGGASRTEAPVPRSLVSPSFTCLEPPHLANLTLENASECLMQH